MTYEKRLSLVERRLQNLYAQSVRSEVTGGIQNTAFADLPAAGQAGRAYYLTDVETLALDTGAQWIQLESSGGGFSFFAQGSTGTPQVVNSGETLTFVSGTAIAVTSSDTRQVTFALSSIPLLALTPLTPAADTFAYYTSASDAALTTLTSFARTLLDDTTADAMRTTLGLPTTYLKLDASNDPLTGQLEIRTTTSPQLLVSYDGSNQSTFAVSSAGALTIASKSGQNLNTTSPFVITNTGTQLTLAYDSSNTATLATSSAGALTIAPKSGQSVTFPMGSSEVVISANSGAIQAPPSVNVLTIASADGAAVRATLDSYGGQGVLTFRRANTSAAAPSALASGDLIGSIAGFGYHSGGAYSTAQTAINAFANEAWTGAARGTRLVFFATPNGSTTLTEVLRLTGNAIGVFGVTPATRAPAYTVTNLTTDRSYDADATSVAELADVLGTLIADLRTYGWVQ